MTKKRTCIRLMQVTLKMMAQKIEKIKKMKKIYIKIASFSRMRALLKQTGNCL